jgi:hypothetical protein
VALRARAVLAGMVMALLSALVLLPRPVPATAMATRPVPEVQALAADEPGPSGHGHRGGVVLPQAPEGKPRSGSAPQPSSFPEFAAAAPTLPPSTGLISPRPTLAAALPPAGALRPDPALYLHPGQAPPAA